MHDNKGTIIGAIHIARDITERKQAEEKLQASEAKYQAIFESTGTATLIVEEDNTIIMANIECHSVTGYTADELTGQKWIQYVSPESLQEMMKNHQFRLQNPELAPKKYEAKLINKKGERRDALFDISIIPGTKQSIVSILDITERKKAEESLINSEERFRQLTENSQEWIWEVDLNGLYTYSSNISEKLLGYQPEEIIGKKHFFDFFIPEEREELKNAAFEVFEQRKPFREFINHNLTKDGNIVIVLTSGVPIVDNNGNLIGYRGVDVNITKRKLMEEKLRESEKNYRLLAESSPEMIYLIDKDGYIKYVNSAAAANFNQAAKNLFGKHLTEVFPPDIAAAHIEQIKQVCETKQKIQKEIVEEFPIGKLWIDVYLAPLLNKRGDVVEVLGLSNNITERKRAEEEIKQKNEELKLANATKDKFFSIIAHDLKSPLNSIVGFSNLLMEKVREKDYDSVEKYSGIIKQSSNRASDLLINLMEWSLSQTGRMDFNPEYFEITNLLNETLPLFDDIAGQKTITITKDFHFSTLVFVDKAMISTVLRNLISNAIKFTHPGGEIVISTKKNQGELTVSVGDNGVGIPKAMIQKIFHIDENYSTSGTNKEKGTGLGLILCKEFIEKNKGNIWMESEIGKGSTIYFTLPIDTKTKEKNDIEKIIPEEDNHINQEVSGLKILITDDDETSLQLISIIVQKFGKELLFAQNGKDAVDACHKNPDIDLILMDIKMTVMDGLEATRQIRKFNTDVIIIAQTAFGLPGDREKAIDAGCNDYISKPIHKDKLISLIQKYFNK